MTVSWERRATELNEDASSILLHAGNFTEEYGFDCSGPQIGEPM
jgi:hypothetical protein